MGNNDIVTIKMDNIKQIWVITDKWFRIIECSIILATLYFFKQKTSNIAINLVYWVSWVLFFIWFLEIGEYVSEVISKKTKSFKNKKIYSWFISILFILMVHFIITDVTNSIILAK